MTTPDTIVALSSGALPAGVAVLRLSGPGCRQLLIEMLGTTLPEARRLTLAPIRLGGEILDRGLVAWFPGPHSFTGEDCAELHLHGSRAVVKAALRALAGRPATRLASAGEFTRRAFENGRLDLTEVQGLGDLVAAETESQRALAYARMDGALTRRLEGWRERLLDLRAEIEAQLDFSDEGDVGLLPATFADDVASLRRDVAAVLAQADQGRIIRDGFRVVLAGPPNSGKSSLLNALSRSDAAIVSDEPGTTRDLKEVPLDLGGQLVVLIDSAGIRETESRAETLGVARALGAMATADCVLWLQAPDLERTDPPDLLTAERPSPRVMRVGTKADLGTVAGTDLSVSVVDGSGIEGLLAWLGEASGAGKRAVADVLVSHEQDRAALAAACADLDAVPGLLDQPELAGEQLRRAGRQLERLIGRVDAEAVLDRLFLSFCIGK